MLKAATKTGLEHVTGKFSNPTLSVEFDSKHFILGVFYYLIALLHYCPD